jgi:hypothetical protein
MLLQLKKFPEKKKTGLKNKKNPKPFLFFGSFLRRKLSWHFLMLFWGDIKIAVEFFSYWGFNAYLKKRIWGNNSLAFSYFRPLKTAELGVWFFFSCYLWLFGAWLLVPGSMCSLPGVCVGFRFLMELSAYLEVLRV